MKPKTMAVRTANTSANGHGVAVEVTHTLDGVNGQAICVPDIAPPLMSGSNKKSAHGAQSGISKDACLIPTLVGSLKGEGFDASEDGTGRGTPIIPEIVGTLSDGAHMGGGLNGQDAYTGRIIPTISHDSLRRIRERRDGERVETAGLQGRDGLGFNLKKKDQEMAVRRLTPKECERLQGFPDDYTLIPFRGKPASDGPRYKALGNSMAVPVMRWIGQRIEHVESLTNEQTPPQIETQHEQR